MKKLIVHFTCTEQEPQAWGLAGADWPERMAQEYAASGDPRYQLTDNPGDADIIVFWEPYQASQLTWAPKLRAHPLVNNYPNKVFVVTAEDEPLGFLPGVYTSLPKRLFDIRRHRTGFYAHTMNPFVQELAGKSGETQPTHLACFVGARTYPARAFLFDHQSVFEPCGITIAETANGQFNINPTNPVYRPQQLHYIETIIGSKFSLCPRGVGTGSFRLQESMALGRAPVIISDQWVPIKGVDWERCAIFVKESEIKSIPKILQALESQWEELGQAARAEWERHVKPLSYALNVMLQIEDIYRNRRQDEAVVTASWDRMIRRETRRRKPPVFKRLKRRLLSYLPWR
jgi:hypothetical protein